MAAGGRLCYRRGMARVFVVGTGPLPESNPEVLGFPQLRTSHTLRVLARAGHTVRGVLLGEDHPLEERSLDGRAVGLLGVKPERAGWLERIAQARREFAPEAVVSAGPYEPARAAALTVGEEPLWVDVPGDPYAEAQAKRAYGDDPEATAHMRAAYAPALARGDAFAAISPSQRAALLGQLGVLGRLDGAGPEHGWAHVVPAAMDFGGLSAGAPRAWEPGESLVVALCGGFNTWLDGETLLRGLHLAMEELEDLRVITTGGAIAGHHDQTWQRFAAGVREGPYPDRFRLLGWIPHQELPQALAEAHVGLTLDRPGLEPELGTRTRVLLYGHLGLAVIANTRSDLCRELAGIRMITGVGAGDPEDLAAAITWLAREGCDGGPTARLQSWLGSRYTLDACFAPLLRWVKAPPRARPGQDPAATLSRELADAREALAQVHATPTWRVSAALGRWLGRRG